MPFLALGGLPKASETLLPAAEVKYSRQSASLVRITISVKKSNYMAGKGAQGQVMESWRRDRPGTSQPSKRAKGALVLPNWTGTTTIVMGCVVVSEMITSKVESNLAYSPYETFLTFCTPCLAYTRTRGRTHTHAGGGARS
jgi:hypothetical protein